MLSWISYSEDAWLRPLGFRKKLKPNWDELTSKCFCGAPSHHTLSCLGSGVEAPLHFTIASLDFMKPHISALLIQLPKATPGAHQPPQRHTSWLRNVQALLRPPKFKAPYLRPQWSLTQTNHTIDFSNTYPCEWSQPDWVEPRISTTWIFGYTVGVGRFRI